MYKSVHVHVRTCVCIIMWAAVFASTGAIWCIAEVYDAVARLYICFRSPP